MLILNKVFLTILVAALVYAYKRKSESKFFINNKIYFPLLSCLIIYILITRFALLDSLPIGLNQDEAAAGYDAWALARFGLDRNGYTFPILPVSWGSGAGGFYFYYLLCFFKVVDLNVFWLRFPNALLHVISLFTLYDLIRKIYNKEYALVGLFFIAISPWNTMISRWGLDANQVFALLLIAIYFTFLAEHKNKFFIHYVSMIFYALALYSYGSSMIVIPLLLIFIYGYLLVIKRISWAKLLSLVIELIILCLPLIIFYIINIFHLTEIRTPFFSIPRFIVLRSSSVMIPFDQYFFSTVDHNFISVMRFLTVGNNDALWNQINEFGIFYLFTFPLFIVGLIISILELKKKGIESRIMLYWFIAACLFSLVVYQNVNRLGILFIPYIFLNTIGAMYIIKKSKLASISLITILIIATIVFNYEYFFLYNSKIQYYFAYGYGDATEYALTLEKENYYLPSQNRVNGSYVLALFYIKPDPNEFVNTVIYFNPNDEFRYARYFVSKNHNFNFLDVNNNIAVDDNSVYIIKEDDLKYFDLNYHQKKQFGLFFVITKKPD